MCHPCCDVNGTVAMRVVAGVRDGPCDGFPSVASGCVLIARLIPALSQHAYLLAFSKVILGLCCSEVMKNRPFWV